MKRNQRSQFYRSHEIHICQGIIRQHAQKGNTLAVQIISEAGSTLYQWNMDNKGDRNKLHSFQYPYPKKALQSFYFVKYYKHQWTDKSAHKMVQICYDVKCRKWNWIICVLRRVLHWQPEGNTEINVERENQSSKSGWNEDRVYSRDRFKRKDWVMDLHATGYDLMSFYDYHSCKWWL